MNRRSKSIPAGGFIPPPRSSGIKWKPDKARAELSTALRRLADAIESRREIRWALAAARAALAD